jgi:tetratricopeptide (TPR) repeat protein
VGALAWGLINMTQSKNQLKSYQEYKKASVVEPEKKSTPEKSRNDSTSDSKESPAKSDPAPEVAQADPAPEETTKVATDPAPAPPPIQLPPETLQHLARGMELAENGKYERAELEFEKAGKSSPDSPEVFSIWGAALRMQKKFEGANKRFARALELAPEDKEIAFNWGLSRLHEKKADEAIKLFEKVIQLDPDYFLAYNYLGKSYGLKKNFPKEEEQYVRVLKIKPDFAQAHFNLGIVRSLQKNFEGAAPHFQKAIELDKQFEKPFVVQFLTAMGLKNPGKGMKQAKLKPTSKKGEQTAKLDTSKDSSKTKKEEKKSEGSDHKMEGSSGKVVKETTNLKGTIKINDQPAGARTVVYLETKNKLKVPKQTTQQIKIFQKGMQFVPAHSVVMVGSTLTFVNDDVEVHNIFSRSLNNQFNLGAMAAGTGKEIKVTRPGPIILRCNIHKDMLGTVFVVPNGYHTQTNDKGEYSFKDVKSQEYILEVWDPQLYPEEVAKNAKNAVLTGVDQTLDFNIQSASQPGEIHDLIDETDYNKVVDNIEEEMNQAIQAWKNGKKYLSRKRMLVAITKYYDGAGLKGAIAKSFSENRSEKLEGELDVIRKQISGIGSKEKITEDSLKFKAKRVIAQLRNNVRELEHRLKPSE